MEYRNLGKSGIQVSALSFGAWVTFGKQVGEDVAFKCMTNAYEAGVNFFDNAEVYSSGEAERVMGNILKKAGWNRDSSNAHCATIRPRLFPASQGCSPLLNCSCSSNPRGAGIEGT